MPPAGGNENRIVASFRSATMFSGWPLPEGAEVVKGLLVRFWVYAVRLKRGALRKGGLDSCFGFRWIGGCHGLRYGVCAPFFSLRLHPNPSLREYACAGYGRRSGPAGPDADFAFATVSRAWGRLNQIDARQLGPGPGATSD
jgi:hypothetical protein